MPTSPAPNGTGRRVEHVSEACIPCRSKKLKCDKLDKKERGRDKDRTACQRCISASRDCTWSTKGDARGAITKDLVVSQQTRILQLEEEKLRLQNEVRSLRSPPALDQMMRDSDVEPSQDASNNHAKLAGGSQTSCTLGPNDQTHRIDSSGHKMDSGLRLFGNSHSTSPFSFHPEAELSFRPEKPAVLPEISFYAGRKFAGDVDWSRHLPTKLHGLLTRDQHDVLLDLFFKFFTSCSPTGLRNLFERGMHHALAPQRDSRGDDCVYYSGMLHNAILAVATAYSDSEILRDVENRMEFAHKAEEYILAELKQPTLSGVQAFAYLADFYSSLGLNVGLVYSGICARIVENMRLRPAVDQTFFESGATEGGICGRDNVFWAAYIQDKISSFYYDRTCAIPIPTRYLSTMNEQSTDKTRGDLSIQQVRLFVHATELKNALGLGYAEDDLTRIALALDQWFNQLPHSMRVSRPQVAANVPPEILVLDITYEWLTIHAYRPFYAILTSQWHALAVKRCDQSALRILYLFNCYKRLHSVRFVPLAVVQMIFTAGAIFVLRGRRLESDPFAKKAALVNLAECLRLLRDISNTWKSAAQMRDILERVRATNLTGSDGDIEMEDGDLKESDGSPSSHDSMEATPLPLTPPTHTPQSPPHESITSRTAIVLPECVGRPPALVSSTGGIVLGNLNGPRSEGLFAAVNPHAPDPEFMNLLKSHPHQGPGLSSPMNIAQFFPDLQMPPLVSQPPLMSPVPCIGRSPIHRGRPEPAASVTSQWSRLPSTFGAPAVTMDCLEQGIFGVGNMGTSFRVAMPGSSSRERPPHQYVNERSGNLMSGRQSGWCSEPLNPGSFPRFGRD